MKKILLLVAFLVGNLLYAQMKVGANPKNISTNTYFEAESQSSRKVVISKDSAKVGIGTASPQFSLEVMGMNNNDAIAIGNNLLGSPFRGKISVLGSGPEDRWMKFNSDWTTTTNNTRAFGFFRGTNEYMTILDNGRVGIGMNTPLSRLVVGAGTGYEEINVRSGGASNASLKLSATGTNGREYAIFSTGTGDGSGAGNLNFFDLNKNTSRILVDSNGFVGINTTVPKNRFEISHGIGGNSGLRFTNLNNANTAKSASSVNQKYLSVDANGDVVLANISDEVITVTGLAFGLTSPVSASTFQAGTFENNYSGTDSTVIYINETDGTQWIYTAANGGQYKSYTAPASTEWYLANGTVDAGSNKTGAIYRTGNVGLGASNPQSRLVVGSGNGYEEINVRSGGNSNAALKMSATGSNGREYSIYSTGTGDGSGAGNFTIFDNNANLNRMLINKSGNVGVGDINAVDTSAQLEVKSTSKGFLPPRMNKTQRDAIVLPASGEIIYCTNCNNGSGCLQVNDGTPADPSWSCLGAATAPNVVATCDGFSSGNFIDGVAVTGASYQVTVTNNSFTSATVAFQSSDLTLSGVTGLTAGNPTGVPALSSGIITLIAGQSVALTYPIAGTPTNIGTVIGTFNKMALTCSKTKQVITPQISSIDCSNATNNGQLVVNTSASGVSSIISYTGGNGGAYSSQSISSIGVTGLTATLNSGTLANGNGSFTFTITGTPSGVGTASFTVTVAGQTCTFTRTVTSITIPANITLAQNRMYMVASVYDQDYLPYTSPTGAASTATVAADGTNEATTVNVQGSISTTGVTVQIPVTAIGSGTLPAFSTTITIPSNMTEDGISRDLMLSWASTAYTSGTTSLTATIKAIGGTLNAKKLDINAGLGSDALGVLMGQFTYPYNNAGATTTYSVRDISGIPDRMFGVADNTGSTTSHNMLYLPMVAEDGNIWLNNNLGAHYSNTNHASFNPAQQATSATDHLAYGSLIQWGRKPDGHELINYTSATAGTAMNGTTSTNSNTPTNALFILEPNGPFDWRSTQDNTLWATVTSANNPCPIGFRVPTQTEQNTLVNAAGITNSSNSASSSLKLTVSGYRDYSNGWLSSLGSFGYYWSNSVSSANASNRFFSSSSTISTSSYRATGFSVRCIKDNTPAASATLNCTTPTHVGTLTNGTAASGVTTTIAYTNGNGGVQYGTSAASTGVTGLTATLAPGNVASGTGNLVFTITGTPNGAGTASFTVTVAGQTCTFTRTVTSITIPANITLAQNRMYMVASVYDQDYLPYTSPTGAASTATVAADGTNEATTVNVQGSISTTGVTVQIPVTATGSGTLPAFSTTITIPSNMTEDGISRDLMLSWASTAYTSGTTSLTATIKAIGGTLNAKKLDINAGLGSDALGVLMGQFTYPYNNAGATTTYSVRDISGIPDRMFGLADNTGSTTSHNMLYLPTVAEDGNIWLNNNLGAHYSNTNHASFNPAQQATSSSDHLAYGNLFQWGRKPDGHELINYTSPSAATALNSTSSIKNDNPTDAKFITNSTTPFDWRITSHDSLWSSVASANNPCPVGFRIPTENEQNALVAAAGITDMISANNSNLKFSVPGYRSNSNGTLVIGSTSYYWNSSTNGIRASNRVFDGASSVSYNYRAYGMTVRCIKDNTPAASATLNCTTPTHVGTLTNGTAASGVTTTIAYTNGNGGVQYGTSAASTGVTGLTATLAPGNVASGTGNLVFTITGTPNGAGTASFTVTVAGQTCTFTRTVTSITIPANITLAQNRMYMVASVYDQDYLPYTSPTGAASTATVAADGTNEATTVNVQGSISTTGVTVQIPVTATGSGTLPAFSTTITIPSNMTEDGISRDLMLSWASTAYTSGTTSLTATIKAIGGTLNAKKLDINAGLGSDALGVLMGQFTYPYNNAGATTTYSVRDISGIPDRMFGLADNTGSTTSHNMLYLPTVAEDGNIWLNNNLGAHYSNTNHASFNPAQQATGATDHLAYGSLFQWGRKPDGHELITFTSATAGTPLNVTTPTNSNAPTDALFILEPNSPYDWRVTQDDTLWATVTSANNPCPVGFRVPTQVEFSAILSMASITNSVTASGSILKLSTAPYRVYNSGSLTFALGSNYWSSNINSTNSNGLYFTASAAGVGPTSRSYGTPVRCIRD